MIEKASMNILKIYMILKFFDRKGLHKDTRAIYDLNGFNKYGNHVETNDKYDPDGFNRKGLHKDARTIYDLNGFNRNGFYKDTKNLYDPNGFDKNGFHKDTKSLYDPNCFDRNGKIKTRKPKSFKDQNGKGHVNLPITLSKIYTNNSSKELINNIKQLINDLYDNEQITKQVYNNLIEAITYK